MALFCSQKACENTIAKLMKEAGIRSKMFKKFKPQTTDFKHAYAVVENVLNGDFAIMRDSLRDREGWIRKS